MLPDGFKKFVVHNLADLEILLMHNREYCAEVQQQPPTSTARSPR
jgi:large subunit ribosomal protein L32e